MTLANRLHSISEAMTTSDEQKWLEAWRYAGRELERIRKEKLQKLDDDAGAPHPTTRSQPYSGLIDFQQWMMRWRVLLLMEQLEKKESSDSGEPQ
ncbi:MAG: hypothetical protein KF851_19320 [Pirellulaceae bacterium]|nr:hypothetical protein [Pirellulaceae bacterium]